MSLQDVDRTACSYQISLSGGGPAPLQGPYLNSNVGFSCSGGAVVVVVVAVVVAAAAVVVVLLFPSFRYRVEQS